MDMTDTAGTVGNRVVDVTQQGAYRVDEIRRGELGDVQVDQDNQDVLVGGALSKINCRKRKMHARNGTGGGGERWRTPPSPYPHMRG